MNRTIVRPALALLGLLAVIAGAYAEVTLMRPSEVTQSGLEDALAPDGDKPLTRGFKPPVRVAEHPGGTGQHGAAIMITFPLDSAVLVPETKAVLDTVAKAMLSPRLADTRFTIEGHADPRGSEGHNLQLSEARANSVAEYLAQTHGIARERLQPVGKGDHELLNRAQPDAPENRRVSFIARTQ